MIQAFSSLSNTPRGKILIVDDDSSVLLIVSQFLERNKYQTTAVNGGEEALKLVRSQNFDLVACDINMPGISGLDFLNALKGIDPTLASVVVTASNSVGMAVEAMKSGALGFVTKPFKEAELLDSIENAIQQARMVRETTAMKLYTPMLESATVALLHALEAKDQDSQGHGQRVAETSQRIAQNMGLSQEETVQIFFGGLFHDIGKIGVPDWVLQKAGPLDLIEQQQMMRHPEVGARIIETVAELSAASKIILHHHERYNGTGYPYGLRGEEIPVGSRIVAVADVYEEMIARRVYADTMNQEQALAEIQKGSGTQFDPIVVETFLKSLSPKR